MAAMNYKQPPKFDESKTSYETWKNEVEIWRQMTELDKKKQALALALSLTDKARETALEVNVDQLEKDDGVKTLLKALDGVFLKEDKDLTYEAYTKFDGYRKPEGLKIADYIYEFELRYSKCKKHKLELPDAILAFKLLDSACLSTQEKMLAMTACGDLTLASMKSALKRIFGERTCSSSGAAADHETVPIQVKQESAFYTSGPRYNIKRTNTTSSTPNTLPVGTNPLNKYGKRTTCAVCRSVYHWAKRCPDNPRPEAVKMTECQGNDNTTQHEAVTESCNITLFTKESPSTNEILVMESLGAAVIDTACTKTVCGENWLRSYEEALNSDQKQKVTKSQSDKRFRFGDGNVVTSRQKVTIPAKIGKMKCNIEAEVVKADIPLLLSKESLKRAETVLDLSNDSATMFKQPVDLEFTSSGHYCIPILDRANDSCSS